MSADIINRDLICALATANGEGGIAIVRASGKNALNVFNECFESARGQIITPNKMMYGTARDSEGMVIDEVMGVYFAAPNSYTRENMFEIQCHGGEVCARRVIKRMLELGARIADAGEFTKRAFLNGRIDLARAEAVMALIGARSEAAALASVRQLEGGVSGFVKGCVSALEGLIALIAASVDFPDEVETQATKAQLLHDINRLVVEISDRVNERDIKLVREGASIVLVGRPNVGKSSLMNALIMQDRAIVTEIAGTTRDVLTERIVINGIAAELSDTAGQRDTTDAVEKIGVDRAKKAMESADIVLMVLDSSTDMTSEDETLLTECGQNAFICLNKSDLPQKISKNSLSGRACYPVSAVTREGIEDLKDAIGQLLRVSPQMENCMSIERHRRLASKALLHLRNAISTIKSEMPLDLIELDLNQALQSLCEITGENATEAVIDRIFKDFCVGK